MEDEICEMENVKLTLLGSEVKIVVEGLVD